MDNDVVDVNLLLVDIHIAVPSGKAIDYIATGGESYIREKLHVRFDEEAVRCA